MRAIPSGIPRPSASGVTHGGRPLLTFPPDPGGVVDVAEATVLLPAEVGELDEFDKVVVVTVGTVLVDCPEGNALEGNAVEGGFGRRLSI